MISVDTERLVDEYMQRLASAARVLPKERQAELLSEIRFHVADALRASDAVDEVDVRNILERIGTPEEIVAAAVEGQPVPGAVQTHFDSLEVAAVLVLGLGGFFFPVIGWLVGVVMVWISGAWSTRDKLIGTAAPFALVFLVPLLFILGGAATGGDSNLGPTEMLFIAAGGSGLFGGVAGALFLAARLSVTTRAEHKRRNVLKIALGVALGGIAFVLVAGLGVVVLRGPGAQAHAYNVARVPVTAAQYHSLKVGEVTLAQVVADFGEPLITCSSSGCEGSAGVSNGQLPGGLLAHAAPVGQQCIYYNHEDAESVYRLCFDNAGGKLFTKSSS